MSGGPISTTCSLLIEAVQALSYKPSYTPSIRYECVSAPCGVDHQPNFRAHRACARSTLSDDRFQCSNIDFCDYCVILLHTPRYSDWKCHQSMHSRIVKFVSKMYFHIQNPKYSAMWFSQRNDSLKCNACIWISRDTGNHNVWNTSCNGVSPEFRKNMQCSFRWRKCLANSCRYSPESLSTNPNVIIAKWNVKKTNAENAVVSLH